MDEIFEDINQEFIKNYIKKKEKNIDPRSFEKGETYILNKKESDDIELFKKECINNSNYKKYKKYNPYFEVALDRNSGIGLGVEIRYVYIDKKHNLKIIDKKDVTDVDSW